MSTVIRWKPVRDVNAFQGAIDRMSDENWRTVRPTSAGNALALDAYETDSSYTIYASLPGISPDQINVSLDDNVLTVSGEITRPSFDEKENVRSLLSERAYGKFSRSVRLSLPVDGDKVEAAYENGILKLVLPKTPAAQPKQIPVKISTNGKLN